jgi:flagellar motor protein MotB
LLFTAVCLIAKVPAVLAAEIRGFRLKPSFQNDLFVMKNGHQLNRTRRNCPSIYLTILVGILATVVSVAGCRQPVANSQASRPALFDLSKRPKIFGGGSQYANSTQQQSSYIGNQLVPGGAQNQQFASIASEVQNLNQRLGAYDSDNQLLNTEIAALTQKLQLANQYNQTIKQQLADTASRIQKSEFEKQSAIQQLAVAQKRLEQIGNGSQFANSGTQGQMAGFSGNNVPSRFAGGATIRANNSLMQRLSAIQIPGGQARMDGDVIRIEFPSDRMFVPGTYQIQPAQLPVMQNIVTTIRQNFPKQIIGIEAHWDNTPLNPPTTTHHQLTATQALSVFDNLVRLGLPNNQMFTMAMASNRPRHPTGMAGGVSPNRRIELVIYPETYDGSN